ncbi:proto-oncogene Mas [Anolis carolinensis]|uniref:proto-oncogene Mas n=1 Tax=Anolis carolinensis TaxID=28377 RepID=UPI000462DF3D|nr:PREDICTED: proto-oncogene Mas-like [Anolis carolinensis]|eukprot:XP_008106551.1 PREDICTED: proto-oncogene Mas-like [Anolis carolinensis]
MNMMMNTTETSQSDYYGDDGVLLRNTSNINTQEIPYSRFYIEILILIICCTGLLGNGTVIWFLGFRMKRNPYTTYILNLAVADIGVLIGFVFRFISLQAGNPHLSSLINLHLLMFMFSNSQILLTVISIERCVSLFFPIWHRCQRPPRLSTMVCALIWSLSFLLYAIMFIIDIFHLPVDHDILLYHILLTAIFCLPLVTVSSVILSIKFCFKSQQQQRRKILMIILLTLLFFFMLDFPFNAILVINFIFDTLFSDFFLYSFLCICLNSNVNPLIYFLVGRKKESQPKENTEENSEQRGRLQMENRRQALLLEAHV